MSTPDELAATLPESTWKDRPLPVVGHKVRVNFPAKRDGRTRWELAYGIVVNAVCTTDTTLVITLDNTKSYLIDSASLLDNWSYVDTEALAREPLPVAEVNPAAVAHEERLASDLVYRHHWETLTERMELNRLDAERGDETSPFGLDLSDEPEQNIAGDVPDPYADTLSSRLRRLEYLDDQIKAREAETKGLKEEYDQLCSVVMEHMSEEGVPSITVDGNTWYMKGRTYVERLDGVTTEDVRDALVASGYGSMVTKTYNTQSLAALLREFENSEGQIPIPEPLAAVVRLGRTTAIGRTQAAARKRRAPISPAS